MSARNFRKMVVLVVVLVCMSAGLARADKLQLQEKLSKDVRIQLNDVTIAEVLEKIGQKAGVKFVLSDEAAWKLPQGEATRLSVTLDGPLAESMAEMLNAFFMRYAVGDEEITVYPRGELEHILGRPTTKQLELLGAIYTKPIKELEVYKREVKGEGDKFHSDLAKTLRSWLGYELPIFPVPSATDRISEVLEAYVGKSEWGGATGIGEHRLNLATSVTLGQVLDQLYEIKWYLSGMDFPNQTPGIRVVGEEDFRQTKLDQIVDISFKDERADVILQRLVSWTGMELVVNKHDPLWLSENISVDMQNIRLQQALRNIVSIVDGRISIDIGDNSIRVLGVYRAKGKRLPAKTGESKDRLVSEGYVGKISIPMEGGKYYIEFMLRENDLTEELKKLREEKMKDILGEKAIEQKIEKKSG